MELFRFWVLFTKMDYACHITLLENLKKDTNTVIHCPHLNVVISIIVSLLLNIINVMSLSQRNDLSRSLERKSLHRDQLNALLYRNVPASKPKEPSLGRASNLPSSRSKAKSSTGHYAELEPKKHSIDMVAMPFDRAGMSGWAESGLLVERRPKLKGTRNHYEFLHVMGRGGFSKVWKVEEKKTGRTYALKEMSKAL